MRYFAFIEQRLKASTYPDGNPTSSVFQRSISSGTTAKGGFHSQLPPPRFRLKLRPALARRIWLTKSPLNELNSSSITRIPRAANRVTTPAVKAPVVFIVKSRLVGRTNTVCWTGIEIMRVLSMAAFRGHFQTTLLDWN
jgi:hypothetical protein